LTFACLTIKVAKRNDSDPTDPEETLESIQQEAKYSLLNKPVLEICRKYSYGKNKPRNGVRPPPVVVLV
jgi:hypothetical protein